MVSTMGIASVLLLVAGIVVALVSVNKEQHDANTLHRVATPIMGGSENLRQGPWPSCVGMEGQACCDLIESHVDISCVLVPENSMVTMDFLTSRVRVFCDDDNVVTKIPRRG